MFQISRFDSTCTVAMTAQATCALISGPQASGKTSLAFQFAIAAAQNKEWVLYCVNQKVLQKSVPKPQISLHNQPEEVLKLIEFVYVESFEGVCQALGTIGTSKSCCDMLPNHIIIESSELHPQTDARALSATLSCLGNTIDGLRAAGHPACGIFITDQDHLADDDLSTFPYAIQNKWLAINIEAEPATGKSHVRLTVHTFGATIESWEMGLQFGTECSQVTTPLHQIPTP